MPLQRTFYEVLGVSPGASQAEIKTKYRELARKFHPDLAQDKKLGQKIFTQVNQAYRVLGDAERRSVYDASMEAASNSRSVRPVNNTGASNPSSVFQSNSSSPFQSSGSAANPGNIKSGPQAVQTAANTAKKPITASPPPKAATKPAKPVNIAALLNQADRALMEGNAEQARIACETLLKAHPDNAQALGLYGDALAQLKDTEAAASAYLKAIQIAPTSLLEAKLKRLQFASKAVPKKQPETTPVNEQKPTPTQAEPEKRSKGMLGRILGRK